MTMNMSLELMADLAAIDAEAMLKREARLRQDIPAYVPKPSSENWMRMVLEAFESHTDKDSGLTPEQVSGMCKSVGMDPRGLGVYYRNGLLKSGGNSRWITKAGLARLQELNAQPALFG